MRIRSPGFGIRWVGARISVREPVREDLIDHRSVTPNRRLQRSDIRQHPAIQALHCVGDARGDQVDAPSSLISKGEAELVPWVQVGQQLEEDEAQGGRHRLKCITQDFSTTPHHHEAIGQSRLGPGSDAISAVEFTIYKGPVVSVESNVPRRHIPRKSIDPQIVYERPGAVTP
jgi:hypothetical protein